MRSLAVLAISMSLVACGEVADSAAADPTVPAIEVTSVELAKAFEANEVAAQQTYGAAPLLVSGEVADISLDFMDQPVVELPGVNQFMNVQANLGEEGKAASAQLTKGQAVVVRCAKLTEVAGTPMLSDCTIQ